MKPDNIKEALTAAPPISVTGLTLMGYPLSDLVLIGTALYTLFLLIDKLPVVIVRLTSFAAWAKEKLHGKESSK
jgi:hypothetical protein